MNKLKAALALNAVILVPSSPLFAQDDGVTREVMVSQFLRTTSADAIRRPKAIEPESWASVDDFPAEITPRPVFATARAFLTIGADGTVESCSKQKNGRVFVFSATLDQKELYDWAGKACEILRKRGRFVPAINLDGEPIKVEATASVRFKITTPGDPDPEPEPILSPLPPPSSGLGTNLARLATPKAKLELKLADSAITNPLPRVRLSIEKDGTVSNCLIFDSTGSDNADGAVCRYLLQTDYLPRLNYKGVEIKSYAHWQILPITEP